MKLLSIAGLALTGLAVFTSATPAEQGRNVEDVKTLVTRTRSGGIPTNFPVGKLPCSEGTFRCAFSNNRDSIMICKAHKWVTEKCPAGQVCDFASGKCGKRIDLTMPPAEARDVADDPLKVCLLPTMLFQLSLTLSKCSTNGKRYCINGWQTLTCINHKWELVNCDCGCSSKNGGLCNNKCSRDESGAASVDTPPKLTVS